MGYCPFPAPGCDTAGGVRTWVAGCAQGRRAYAHGQVAARAAVPALAHDTGAWRARPGLSRNGVATHFLVSRHGWPSWRRDLLLVSQHTFWCRDMV